MKIYPYDNNNFKASINIFSFNNPHSPIKSNDIKFVEKKFANLTRSERGHMDIILYDRYNYTNAKPDRILFSEGHYMDSVDTYVKNITDSTELTKKLVDVFMGFKKIKNIKDSIKNSF